ncbi:MAG: Gfo/Idh/MocA family oxidoreductase [Candidatus Hydrothermae bacterium]|nr:Gfo/Idh/MocA family oxidoreductase [Candidatus Hydrothermae bacterium]RKY99815.1 MAG: gfo/Idh/MocA family oxidoreductase [Candidatus Hydrothermae bacterium]
MATRVAVIGLGYWGPNLMRNLTLIPDVQVIAGCDLSIRRLERMMRRFPNVREFTTDCDILLRRPDIDAVVIATPVETHYKLAKKALLHDKDVFIEKPMTASSEEAEELIKICEERGRILMVGHTFLYNPAVRKVKEIIDKGDLGQIYYITSTRINLGIHRKDANVIWDLAAHDFSIIIYWLGEDPLYVYTVGKDFILNGVPDVAFLHVVFPSGVIADLQVSWLAPSKVRNITVVGSDKMIIYDDTSSYEKVRIFDSGVDYSEPETFGEFQLSYRTGDILSPKIDSIEPLRLEMQHFIECIRERTNPMTDGYNGLRVVRALELAERSMKDTGLRLISEKSKKG